MVSRKDSTTTTAPTPGPWTARANMSGVTIINPDGIAVARTPCCDRQAVADGALIAAAPLMFGVLLELSASAHYWGEYDVPIGIVDRIRAALDKAEGKS